MIYDPTEFLFLNFRCFSILKGGKWANIFLNFPCFSILDVNKLLFRATSHIIPSRGFQVVSASYDLSQLYQGVSFGVNLRFNQPYSCCSVMAQSFTTHFTHDVFLSFRGEDTRYNFTGNLYDALDRRGINTFLDDQSLRVGDKISTSLLKAIEESRVSVVVFSENYASSTWCLDELVKILECKEQNNQRVWPIFYKVDPSDVRHQKNSYGKALTEHENKFGKGSDSVKNWRSALTEAANLKGDHFIAGNDYEYRLIDKIVKKICTRSLAKFLHVGEHIVGLEPRIEEVISLLDVSSRNTVCMLGIYGIGGIGKTTLAKALYNSIAHQFDYVSFLSDVRETSNESNGLLNLQKTLLSDMFEVEDINLKSVDEGTFQIKNRLRHKSVLLVFDDVDHEEQLEKLVGECNWYGSGSRIIMTTRDKHLLHASRVEKTYEMRGLNTNKASELFCWYAFNSGQPPEEFVDLCKEMVNYTGGLPLALNIIGSNMAKKDLNECICALDQYKKIPNKRIQAILEISYVGLEENQQKIFLDIACFFKGYHLQEVTNIWEACDFGPEYHIGVLVDKSLITISEDGCIRMHDLIQDMGKEVVRKVAPQELGERSRLWLDDEVVNVLRENLGTNKIEGILLESPQQKIKWNGIAFKKMTNLRMLIVKNAFFSEVPKYLPNSLRILKWNQCPLTSLPSNFELNKLVVLQMPNSSLKLEKSFKNLKCLSVVNFSDCQSISKLPDMSEATNLISLDLSFCKNLVKIHDSIGFLTKIKSLCLTNCKNLMSLPSVMQMASLEWLYMGGCTSLLELPNSIGNLTRLHYLNISGSNVMSIPESIRKLSNLKFLRMDKCKNLKDIYEIPSNLSEIYARDCTSLTLHSRSVLWSQAIKETCYLDIEMPGAQIPDWFDHCCRGQVLSFWVRHKFPSAAFAFIYRSKKSPDLSCSELRIVINGLEVMNRRRYYGGDKRGSHVFLEDMEAMCRVSGRKIEDLSRHLVQEWNYVEIEVKAYPPHYGFIEECGIHLYRRGISIEDVCLARPFPTLSAELRNALTRRTMKWDAYSIKESAQTLWEKLWDLRLPSKVIIFLWELVNSDPFDFIYAQVPRTCSLCGVENETSQHIFMQCTFARALWFGFQLSIRPDNLESLDVVNLIKSCLRMGHINAEIHERFTYPVAAILYTIWYFRNKAILIGESPSSEAALKMLIGICARPFNFDINEAYTLHSSEIGGLDLVTLLPLNAWEIYLSIYQIEKITCCRAFIIGDMEYKKYEGYFFIPHTTTESVVLFKGFKSLLKDHISKASALSIYMPNSSYIVILNKPLIAPSYLQAIVKDVKRLLMMSSSKEISCKSFPHTSFVSDRSGSLRSKGKWTFFPI